MPVVCNRMPPDEALGVFLVSIATGLVLGTAVLLLIYKMVDGDLPVLPGICSLIMILFAMALAIKPPHPAVTGVIFVLALTLMAVFPYAEQKLEEFELRAIDAERLARSFSAVQARPDNFAAKFELARQLYDLGFHAQAIHLTSSTLDGLDTEQDQVRNQSLRDVFHREQVLLRRWQGQPMGAGALKCPSCGAFNRPTDLFCSGCGQPHMLNIVRGQEVKPRVWAKLVLAWAALALFIPGSVAIGMNLDGVVRFATFAASLAAVGILIGWLFRPPKHAKQVYG